MNSEPPITEATILVWSQLRITVSDIGADSQPPLPAPALPTVVTTLGYSAHSHADIAPCSSQECPPPYAPSVWLQFSCPRPPVAQNAFSSRRCWLWVVPSPFILCLFHNLHATYQPYVSGHLTPIHAAISRTLLISVCAQSSKRCRLTSPSDLLLSIPELQGPQVNNTRHP